jgi:plasmid stabilization system protein ParE
VRVEFHPAAAEEVDDARRWYERRRPQLGDAFAVEVEIAVAAIVEHPGAWTHYDEHTRRFVLRRFPYEVVYAIEGDLILVLAVAHAKRRPKYWRERLR